MFLQLPLINVPSQEFIIQLGEKKFQFKLDLNTRTDLWSLSISTESGEPLLQGIALVLGVDFLSNKRFINGLLYLVDYAGLNEDPTANTLDKFGLVWSDQ
ncbi:hypothetical protein MMP74_14805 [Acinetobacter sp. NIPH 1869]|uniref:phage baseplate plug family protein n=1 Tax=Acinetobacter higginsii TaxID=70347 RepID=UPI001F4ABBCA|nr:hypothetical protein [Acinetobacter higginsii]MCH7305631.1 hypothetical protein [Acinetobacter higginsii]